MKVKEIRSKFLAYFESKNHTLVKSSSLIPVEDNSLLFTNAGMNQFKDVFLGLEKRSYVRATSVQKCVRAGGKHNDLENVGYTARHHTFFEMLGNFSFGDYFKKEALTYAWEFLTQVLSIPKDKLYVTVYYKDDDAYDVWVKIIGLEPNRVIRIGDKADGGSDNFWQMGDIGPCGPCSEIFYDHGSEIEGGLPGTDNENGDRYIEIWNCVFMQYNRDKTGKLHLLPKPSVDTGMGLERIAAVLQNVNNNYEIDLFVSIIKQASIILNCDDLNSSSLKIIADHIRSICFLIADGCFPSNEGRGYVLRRIIRRAIRHGYMLGKKKPFLYKLVDVLVNIMGDPYEELIKSKQLIESVIELEEEKFFQTIIDGMEILKTELKKKNTVLSGSIAFKLYDTYGFPLDLTEDICKEYKVTIDINSYNECMLLQKKLAKDASKFKNNNTVDYSGVDTKFDGYLQNKIVANVVAIYKSEQNQNVTKLSTNESAIIVLDKTVMYPESGGQAADIGFIKKTKGHESLFDVIDTQKIRTNVISHIGILKTGDISVGDEVEVAYDLNNRRSTARNHSATHLLHQALKLVLGNDVNQKGSYVCSSYTRFDFSYDKPLTSKQLLDIENIVNSAIFNNYIAQIKFMKYDEAVKSGAIALFGEKYSEYVRVLCFSDFSIELCGGTHVGNTSEIGFFLILSEKGVSNGVRRIEAITGESALKKVQDNRDIVNKINDLLKTKSENQIFSKILALEESNRFISKQVSTLNFKLLCSQLNDLESKINKLRDDNNYLLLKLDNLGNKTILDFIDVLKNKYLKCIFIIMNITENRVSLIVSTPDSMDDKYPAMKIMKYMSEQIGGHGGGNSKLAQGGGVDLNQLNLLINSIDQYLNSL